MFRNYLKTAFRSLSRNKSYALVSIFGLALGISCCTLIALYVSDELSYEQMHEHKDEIYRVYVDLEMTETLHAGVSPMAIGPTLVSDYPNFKSFSRFVPMGDEVTIRIGEDIYKEPLFWFADSSFFDVFTYPFIKGDPVTALIEPKTVVLTESMAQKFFGTIDVLDSTIKVNSSFYRITGVCEDPPTQTETQFNALISVATWPQQTLQQASNDWYWLTSYTYVRSHQPISEKDLTAIMADFKERYIIPFQESNGLKQDARYMLKPLKTLHFYTEAEYDHPKGNLSYLYIFGVVGVFILIIASINFVNLSLAQSGKRAKEVGIRKTLGGSKKEIQNQFLGESLLVAFLATLLGLALVEILLPLFNDLSGKEFGLGSLFRFDILFALTLLWLAVGFLSGAYPAFVLSRFDPVQVLKGQLPSFGRIGVLRRVLVVVQFVFSILMIIGTLVVFNQMRFMQNRNLGFKGDQVIALDLPRDTSLVNRSTTLRLELEQLPFIETVTLASHFPGRTVGELLFRIEQDGALVERGIKYMVVDEYFTETYGVQIDEGRNFNRENATDENQAFIINKRAAEVFGWKDDPIGKRMQWGLQANDSAAYDGRVVGVVEDFHFTSLHNPIDPLVLRFNTSNSGLVAMKVKGENMTEALSEIRDVWSQFSGGFPFEYQFVDDEFAALYRNEERMLTIFGYFSFISIFISILGLFALSSFTIEQRIKEIGVRKILGASVGQIIQLISKDFLLLVIVAIGISVPIGYYFLNRWLQNFAFHTDLPIILFVLAALLALVLAYLTVGYHSLRAARSNPVNALRYE